MISANATIVNKAVFVLDCSVEEIEQLISKGFLLDTVKDTANWLGEYFCDDLSGELYKRYKAADELISLLRGEDPLKNDNIFTNDEDIITRTFENIISESKSEMFEFDLQLFASSETHRASKHYVRSMKGHEGNAMAYNIKAVPTDKRGNYKFVINREYAEITPLTRSCLLTMVFH